jgi:hypothetical protein
MIRRLVSPVALSEGGGGGGPTSFRIPASFGVVLYSVLRLGENNKPTEQPEKVRRDEPPNFVLLPFFVVVFLLFLFVSLSLDHLLLAVS